MWIELYLKIFITHFLSWKILWSCSEFLQMFWELLDKISKSAGIGKFNYGCVILSYFILFRGTQTKLKQCCRCYWLVIRMNPATQYLSVKWLARLYDLGFLLGFYLGFLSRIKWIWWLSTSWISINIKIAEAYLIIFISIVLFI